MRGLSWRAVIPIALVVTAWGGLHALTSHTVAVTPTVWPVAQPSASSSPSSGVVVAPPTATAAPQPSAGGSAIPILPDALRQLNNSTRDTATGLYAVIQQLEAALGSHFDQLVKQLEPGR